MTTDLLQLNWGCCLKEPEMKDHMLRDLAISVVPSEPSPQTRWNHLKNYSSLPTKSWQIIHFGFQLLIIRIFYYAVITDIIGIFQVSMTHFLFHYRHLWVTVISLTTLSTNYMMIVLKSNYFPLNSRPMFPTSFFAFTWYLYLYSPRHFKFDPSKLIYHPILSYPKIFHLLIFHLTECNHYPTPFLSSLKTGCFP